MLFSYGQQKSEAERCEVEDPFENWSNCLQERFPSAGAEISKLIGYQA